MKHLLTERAALGPVTTRKVFVDDTNPFRTMRIPGRQEPSGAQRNTKSREVIAVDSIGIVTVQRFARPWHIALRSYRGFAVISAQRDVCDRSGGGHSPAAGRLIPAGDREQRRGPDRLATGG